MAHRCLIKTGILAKDRRDDPRIRRKGNKNMPLREADHEMFSVKARRPVLKLVRGSMHKPRHIAVRGHERASGRGGTWLRLI